MDSINEICSTTIFDYLVTSINDIDQFFRISGHTRRTINFDRLLQNLCMRNIKKYLQFDYLFFLGPYHLGSPSVRRPPSHVISRNFYSLVPTSTF